MTDIECDLDVPQLVGDLTPCVCVDKAMVALQLVWSHRQLIVIEAVHWS